MSKKPDGRLEACFRGALRAFSPLVPSVTGALRSSLEPLAAGRPPVLFGGLEPYPDNWRASVRRPATLPHFPVVLHRGGYPDGS